MGRKSLASLIKRKPLVVPIASKIFTGCSFNMLNPNLQSDLLSDHSRHTLIITRQLTVQYDNWIFIQKWSYSFTSSCICSAWYTTLSFQSSLNEVQAHFKQTPSTSTCNKSIKYKPCYSQEHSGCVPNVVISSDLDRRSSLVTNHAFCYFIHWVRASLNQTSNYAASNSLNFFPLHQGFIDRINTYFDFIACSLVRWNLTQYAPFEVGESNWRRVIN